MVFRAKPLFPAIVFVCFLLVSVQSQYIVEESPCLVAGSCMSLNDYARNATFYLTSNTTFIFLEGHHYLETSLKIENAYNLAMEGMGSGNTILFLKGEISWINSSEVTLRNMRIIYDGLNSDMFNSTLYFQNCTMIYLVGMKFTMKNYRSVHFRGVEMLNSSATISNCTLSGVYLKEGGAIYLQSSNVSFSGTSLFENNTALERGGAIRSVHSVLNFSGKVNFNGNKAEDGGAIYSSSSDLTLEGDIVFSNNHGLNNGGGVYLENSSITFRKKILFYSNLANCSGGSVYLDNSTMRISETVSFHNNRAQRFGGGLAFSSSAQIIFQMPVTVTFLGNEADYGGAIHNEEMMRQRRIEELTICFFKIEGKNISHEDIYINFTKNYARSAGSDVFDGTLDRCHVQTNRNGDESETGLYYLQNISTFNHLKLENSSLSSPPRRVCFCTGETLNCSAHHEVSTPHGKTFHISVVTVGLNAAPVPSAILHTYTTGLQRKTCNIDIPSRSCYNISFQLLSSDSSASFKIYPKDCVTSCTDASIEVKFQECPPGFSLVNNECKCDSKLVEILGGEDSCSIETGLIRRHRRLWIEPVFENDSYAGFKWSEFCPRIFCREANTSHPMRIDFSSSNWDGQCQEYHTGIMCGACMQNYSLTLDNFDCEICGNRGLILLVPFMLYGIVMIAIFFALHMTVAAGTLNGLILYANIIYLSRGIFFPPGLKQGFELLPVFIAWMNLDIGISNCFYNGLDYYTHAWLQFFFPFYLWALVGLIVLASKLSTRAVRLFGSNPVAVLATVILMSFTKLLHVSQDALSFLTLEYSDNSSVRVWYQDPSVSYFEGKHVPLALFAIGIISFLIVPYFFLLLFGFVLQAHSNRRGLHWVNKFKPLLDAYYAPFHKHTRCWIGLMLMVRGGLYISYTVTKKQDNDFTLLVETFIFIVIASVPWLGIRVYEKRYLDILEASFIINICFLSIVTYNKSVLDASQETLTSISVGVAFAEFVGILIFHVMLRIQEMSFFNKVKNSIENYVKSFFKGSAKEGSAKGEPIANENMDKHTCSYVTRISIFDIREPLLEDV